MATETLSRPSALELIAQVTAPIKASTEYGDAIKKQGEPAGSFRDGSLQPAPDGSTETVDVRVNYPTTGVGVQIQHVERRDSQGNVTDGYLNLRLSEPDIHVIMASAPKPIHGNPQHPDTIKFLQNGRLLEGDKAAQRIRQLPNMITPFVVGKK